MRRVVVFVFRIPAVIMTAFVCSTDETFRDRNSSE